MAFHAELEKAKERLRHEGVIVQLSHAPDGAALLGSITSDSQETEITGITEAERICLDFIRDATRENGGNCFVVTKRDYHFTGLALSAKVFKWEP